MKTVWLGFESSSAVRVLQDSRVWKWKNERKYVFWNSFIMFLGDLSCTKKRFLTNSHMHSICKDLLYIWVLLFYLGIWYCIVLVLFIRKKKTLFFWSTNSCLKVDAFLRKQTTVAHKHIRQMFCAFMH